MGSRAVLRRIAACLCCLLFLLGGCDRALGKKVYVDFRAAEGFDGGESVYLAGIRIGTTGDPELVGGHARVPVYLSLKRKDALPDGAVFVVQDDSNKQSAKCLVAYDLGEVVGKQRKEPGVYPGASSPLEAAIVIGAEAAKRLMEQLK
jgi:hypothetical protein